MQTLPGFTTNVQFGQWMSSGKIVIGSPVDSQKNQYLKFRCNNFGITWNDTIQAMTNQIVGKLNFEQTEKIWFTSDTHFGQQRTLILSKRPFKNVQHMDKELINR